MTGVPSSLVWTQSDAISEVLSAESCQVVLEICPLDHEEKLSLYVKSTGRQSKQDKVANEPAEAESDSGDSLFITQKTVPEPVRSARRRPYSLRSDPASPRDLEDSEAETLSPASDGESKINKQKRRKKCRLPRYRFSFLSERKSKPRSTLLPVQQNKNLCNSAMGGFFKCVRELWQGSQREDGVESSLPTVDMEGNYISPLSEEEKERSEDEDIRVVERKCFMAPSEAKSRQTWCNQLKQQRRRKAGPARRETSRGKQWNELREIPAKASISKALDAESTDDGESSCRLVVERERNAKHVIVDRNFVAQKETAKTKRHLTRGNKKILFQQKAREEELCSDSDATVCEPRELQRTPKQCTEMGGKAATEPQTNVLHIDNLSQTEDEPESQNFLQGLPELISDANNNNSVCNETRVKKRKKKKKDKGDHESVEEEKGQRQEEPEGLHAATSVNVEVEETPSPSQDDRAEPPESQTNDELEFNERNCMENPSHDDTTVRREERDIPNSEQKKKKRKKSAAKNVRQEVDGNLESTLRMEDPAFSPSCNMEKKEKRKRKDVEQLRSSAAAEPLNDDAEIEKRKKKKKRKKEETIVVALNRTLDLPPMSTGQLEESVNGLENTAASEETLGSSYVKRRKHKKKHQSSSNDTSQDVEEVVAVSFSNAAVTSEESTRISLKKKKKKKTVSEGVDISYTHEDNEMVEVVDNTQKTKEGLEGQNGELVIKKKKKKKKKKKMSESSSQNISNDNVAQSDDSVSVWKKKKKWTSSFLVADAEENDAQTNGKQNTLTAEKPAVDAGDFETESAEIAGNLEDGGVRKKKKKRKRKMSVEQDGVEKEHEQDFEEPHKIGQSALSETTHTGVKRKKKRMGNESELVTPVERLESAVDAGPSPTDEAVVLKKKKKKKKKCNDEPYHVMQESPRTAAEDAEIEKSALDTYSSVSHQKKGKHLASPFVAKGKHGHSAEISHDSSTSDQATTVEQASPASETAGNQALNDMRDKKKKKSPGNVLLERKSFTKSAELEPQKNKKKGRNKQSQSEMSSSDHIMNNTLLKVQRRLYNSSENFLTDY